MKRPPDWLVQTVTFFATICLCFVAIECSAQAQADNRTPLLIGTIGASLDEITTRVAESRGAVEGNPLLQDRGVRLGVKVAEVGLVWLIDRALQRIDARLAWRGRLPWVWRGLVLARGVVAAGINLHRAGAERRER